ncbi:MAG: RdgB/HAM1 family non-canonical purine NTP pyrophosphatase [Phycisphaerae bacterium]|nr:RdgB/HAM1 family non-canonical purine NTP pyrophosphatase [Phycisphaerae bacterium]
MSSPSIVLATRNPGKLAEIRDVLTPLGVQVVSLEAFGPIPEPPESEETFAGNARRKALDYARATGYWCLADDSGLVVDALDGAPGVRSARYAAECMPADAPRGVIDEANNRRLLEALADVPDERRTARFVCHLTLASPQGVLLEAHGTVEGRIAHRPAGGNGFGYDPLFYVPELGCTTAELPPERKNRISHRGKAVREFAQRYQRWRQASPTA